MGEAHRLAHLGMQPEALRGIERGRADAPVIKRKALRLAVFKEQGPIIASGQRVIDQRGHPRTVKSGLLEEKRLGLGIMGHVNGDQWTCLTDPCAREFKARRRGRRAGVTAKRPGPGRDGHPPTTATRTRRPMDRPRPSTQRTVQRPRPQHRPMAGMRGCRGTMATVAARVMIVNRPSSTTTMPLLADAPVRRRPPSPKKPSPAPGKLGGSWPVSARASIESQSTEQRRARHMRSVGHLGPGQAVQRGSGPSSNGGADNPNRQQVFPLHIEFREHPG